MSAEERIRMEKKQNNTLIADVKWLALKLLLLGMIFAVIWLFLFGVCRCPDEAMSPQVRAGDLVIYDRMTREYQAEDVVVVKLDDELQIRRLAEVTGDGKLRVLRDNRTSEEDENGYEAVGVKDVRGVVITLIRRRAI